MFLIKIISPILVLILTLVQFYIDHRWKDRRTKKYKYAKILFIVIIFVAVVFTIITTVIDYQNEQNTKKQLDDLKKLTILTDLNAVHREKQAISERESLKIKLVDLQDKLDPFLEIAKSKYPRLPTEEALKYLSQEIENIKQKTEIIESATKDRKLTEMQTNQLIAFLSNYKSNKIYIFSIWGDQESLRYAHIIKNIFIRSGWIVDGVNQAMYNIPMDGLFISIQNEPIPEIAQIVFRAFRSIGIETIRNKDSNQEPSTVRIIVGSKINNDHVKNGLK
ncbi:MAG: hypothetical protein Q8O92_00140 [Candidatus Latescibacter sp.]|nr:hypothetical protein [Candidatus Latescibacter sp.]